MKDTTIVDYVSQEQEAIEKSVSLLLNNEIVALPTETVYGLFANALSPEAVAKIFVAKWRPADNPLIVHVRDSSQIKSLVRSLLPVEELLIERCMPGPFTLVLPKADHVPSITVWWLDTICVRISDHPVMKKILSDTDLVLAGPSANRSGKPSPTTAQMVSNDMQGRIDLIIDGGICDIGIESTVVRVIDNIVRILRPGLISREDIQDIVGSEYTVIYADQGINESPGSRYRHYAPEVAVSFFDKFTFCDLAEKKIALIVTDEWLEEYQYILSGSEQILSLWSRDYLTQAAARLYQYLWQVDNLGIDHVLVEVLPEEGIGYAIMNRMRKVVSS